MKKITFLFLAFLVIIPTSIIFAGTTGLVNGFEGVSGTAGAPPGGSLNDCLAWVGAANMVGAPLPLFYPYYENIGIYGTDSEAPANPPQGTDMMSASWYNQKTYLYLIGADFENNGGSTGWSNYDYISLLYAQNSNEGAGYCGANQQVQIIDNGATPVTVTSSALQVDAIVDTLNAGFYLVVFDHLTMSLNYLANHYDTNAGRAFNVGSINYFVIDAPSCNGMAPLSPAIFYYDDLTLGAHSGATPFWSTPPSGVTVSPINPPNWTGVTISWNFASQTGQCPITGYHIYRQATWTASPFWQEVAVVSNNTNSYVDNFVTNFGSTGGSFCYKVLTLDNGPGTVANTGDWHTNTINATYDEALLSAATEACVVLTPIPGPSNTPCAGCSPVPSVSPTPTFIPPPVTTPSISNAYVYPNPFNPNEGTGRFHVGNVPAGTKVSIYSMAGNLVYDGTVGNSIITDNCPGCFEWNGKNKNNSQVVTGLYFVVLQSGSSSQVYRVTVCYKCDPVDHTGTASKYK